MLSVRERFGVWLFGYKKYKPYEDVRGYQPEVTVAHTEPVELYHHVMSFSSQHARVALSAVKLAYKAHHVKLMQVEGVYEPEMEYYMNIHPGRVVPCLVLDGHPVYKAIEILRHLEKTHCDADESGIAGDLKSHTRIKQDRLDEWHGMVVAGLPVVPKGPPSEESMTETAGVCVIPITMLMLLPTLRCGLSQVGLLTLARELVRGLLFHFDWHRPVMFTFLYSIALLPSLLSRVFYVFVMSVHMDSVMTR